MTVTIDPSEIRPGPVALTRRPTLPVRTILLTAGGGLGLVAFTFGAFSFFSGLADPRARTIRPMPFAASLPDLKDGVPALVPSAATGQTAKREASVVSPTPAPEREEVGLRAEAQPTPRAPLQVASAEPPAAVSDATGSVAPRGAATVAKIRPAPPIENAAVVAADRTSVPLVAPARIAGPLAPAKAETVRARTAEPRAFASLPSEPTKPEPTKPESAKPVAAGKPKPAHARATAAKPVAEASAQPQPMAQAKPVSDASDDPEVMGVKIWGGREIRNGIKAVFGGDGGN